MGHRTDVVVSIEPPDMARAVLWGSAYILRKASIV